MINKLLFLLLPIFVQAQILTGKVVDVKTREPLEMVSVYFDNTTIGTSTNANGEFSIEYNETVQSTLVISYLGFEKVYITNYRQKQNIEIALVEAKNELDEVVISVNDILTRRQKLRLFREYFLGTTSLGKKCKILNEDDLILRYNDKDKTLYADARTPVVIYNKGLGYELSYDLIDFEIQFRYVDAKANKFTFYSAYFLGTVFFKDLNQQLQKSKFEKRRQKAFQGSIQHFMRALYNEDLEAEDYIIFRRGFKVDPWEFLKVNAEADSSTKTVQLNGRISILYNDKIQSDMYLSEDISYFTVDSYGHYEPILGVQFTGDMNEQRVGNMLPLDYGLN